MSDTLAQTCWHSVWLFMRVRKLKTGQKPYLSFNRHTLSGTGSLRPLVWSENSFLYGWKPIVNVSWVSPTGQRPKWRVFVRVDDKWNWLSTVLWTDLHKLLPSQVTNHAKPKTNDLNGQRTIFSWITVIGNSYTLIPGILLSVLVRCSSGFIEY